MSGIALKHKTERAVKSKQCIWSLRSIRFKLVLYLAIFVITLIGVLWLFQIVFLGDVYRHIKVNEVQNTAEILRRDLASFGSSASVQETVQRLSSDNQICIEVLDTAFHTVAEKSSTCYSTGADANCFVHISARYQPFQLIDVRYLVLSEIRKSGEIYFENTAGQTQESNQDAGMLYIEYYQTPQSGYYIILNTKITPVNATVNTLKIELYLICGIFIGLAVLMAFFLSKRISSPIEKINEAAKQLAKGDYSTVFEGGGYDEIAELRDTLNYASKELSKVETFRRELLANISHDLRTPLTMITGYAEVMRDLPDENTPENVQVIIDEASRLTMLVNDLLDLSKLQSGAAAFTPTVFCLTDCIHAIISRYQKLKENDGYQIDFIYDTDVFVYADDSKLQQVIYNLVNNAISYTGEDKTVTIRQTVSTEHGKQYVRIAVTDTGVGISPENIDYIWDRYFKENKTHKRAVVGTGLGLSIVKGVLQLHHAEFGVESSEASDQHGSTFWFAVEVYNQEKSSQHSEPPAET